MYLTNKFGYRALCLVSLLLSACGGGGGAGGGNAAPGTTTVRSAYVANYGANNISQYSIDPTTGALNAMTSAIVPAGINPTSVIADSAGKHVYVANSVDSVISQYNIGPGGGLVPMTPAATVQSGSVAGAGPISIAIAGGYAYAANSLSVNAGGVGDITQFSIDPTTGALTNLATVLAGINPIYVAVTPDSAVNKYAYVLNAGVPFCYAPVGACVVIAPTILEYSINSTTGALALIGPGPVTLGLGTAPSSIVVDTTGNFAYLANSGTASCPVPSGTCTVVASSIAQYSITAGVLTPVASVGPGTVLTAATSIAIDPTNAFAYAANGSGVYQYTINSVDGTLADIVTTPAIVPAYTGGFTQRSITINEGKFVYMANLGSDDISQFSIGTNGALTPIGPNIASGTGISQPTSITTAISIQ